ncbi:MAG TPA: aminotransferase class I/II-fold pyridoxal phosphate-dependent enzyme [Saprospiraceae bacterium]|nr:aminotransferase class I/II-fold pyridoxal phosphate-dependent enzyme [Saprospiraceae bacterium]HPI08091.1 aminotransferase class I/II-fold pyridoxal phosphate-dependent enzyme [Saprospiraceae bacterium]
MLYKRMPIEIESPEEFGYDKVLYNLSESSVTDLKMSDLQLSLDNLELSYVPHKGNFEFRQAIANEFNLQHPDNVLLTNGAAGALFIVNTALLTAADHLVIVRPNYATNIEVPRAICCDISFIDLAFEEGWRLDPRKIAEAIRPNTKLISITTPHNPTGMLMTQAEIDAVVHIAEQHNIFLLVDETYRDACFKTPYPIIATRSSQVISVASLSKAYGLPGLRMGWLITQNEVLMELFLAAKEMIYISNSALDEAVACQFYLRKEKFIPHISRKCLKNFEILQTWLTKETRVEAILPEGGVVCFLRMKQDLQVDTNRFYHLLLHEYKTMVGPGHWFDMPDTYLRVGFGYTTADVFEKGLECISKAMDKSLS